ncbi:VOC family protein [Nostocaceae cyanobacterium CENA369]|uniref:VOC family protein n=1 Tax=Dendronalium phyllosphericum CENA369 TaxID=1725256 RepID=A0A8J7I523_9NOST|nr:glyoxalase superfamily protein [Dendronalium phyllosphericum]MBH8574855.1 VOC family protein [Dendronalium phyllosphericum CENA369]
MSKLPLLKNISPMIPAGNDVEKSIAFYEQQLGFRKIHQEGNPIKMAVVKRDSAEIFLLRNDDQHLAEGTTFRIQVDGIEQLYQEFQSQNGHIIHPNGELQTKPWGMKEFEIIDIAGVCITFYEPENR